MSDNLERELKLPVSDLDRLRERLAELEAERLAPSAFEDNWMLDRDGELERAGAVLRLRRDRHGARVTYKGRANFEGATKLREEHESRVENGGEVLAVFERLGYRVVRRYQKLREEWRLGGVTVALDHTPIGDFAEFEGTGAETVARRCGYDPTASERRTYIEIYEEHLRRHPEAPTDMVFP